MVNSLISLLKSDKMNVIKYALRYAAGKGEKE